MDELDAPKTTHLIYFEDADMRPEVFTSEPEAVARYGKLQMNWNCHLFVASAQIQSLTEVSANHVETLRSIKAMPVEDGARMQLWASDALSGYTESVDVTMAQLRDQIAALTEERNRLREDLDRYRAAGKRR